MGLSLDTITSADITAKFNEQIKSCNSFYINDDNARCDVIDLNKSEGISEKDKVIKRSRKENANDKLAKWLREFNNAK